VYTLRKGVSIMLTHRISLLTGILLASSLCPVLMHGQAPAPSVADAARKAREQNKSRQPAKVFTNEDIPDLKGTISVVGTPPPEPAPAPAPAPDGSAPATAAPAAAAGPKTEAKDEAYWRAKFAESRKKLADDTKEADILQREYNLKEQQFYSNPNVALREQNSRADLNKTLEQINAKKADVAKDQQATAALEDQLRQAGGNPGWAREPTQ
jgi:vancomycin resistance protein YoaR